MMITTVPTVAQHVVYLCDPEVTAAPPRVAARSLRGPCGWPVGSAPRQPVQGAYLASTPSGTRYEHTRVVTSHFRNVHPYLQRRSRDANCSALSFFFSPFILFYSLFFVVSSQWLEGLENWPPDRGMDKEKR